MVQYRPKKRSPWVVQYRPDHGKRMGKVCTRSFAKRQDAQSFEMSLIRGKQLTRAGLEAPKEEILLIDYARRWLKQRYAEKPKATVNQDESRLRNYWLPEFGTRPLQTLTSTEIKQKLDQIQFEFGHSVSDRDRHRALLHKLFQDALMDDKVIYNPLTRVPLKTRASRLVRISLSETEQAAYLDALLSDSHSYWLLGMLLIWTGARICSANVLQYQDFDFELNVVRIRRLEERATGQVVTRQKGGGETYVPLFPILKAAILSHRKLTNYIRPTDYVAHGKNGKFIPYEAFKGAHIRAVQKSGITRITPHDLRSTFAQNAERAGYLKTEIRDMLGHSSVLVTERYTPRDIRYLVEKGQRLEFGNLRELIEMRGKSE